MRRTLAKHWGRVRLPAELDVQDDPAIHYHFRDLFTGEMYVRPGDELARRGLVVGLAPHELHVLRVGGRQRRGHGRRAEPGRAPGRLGVPQRLHETRGRGRRRPRRAGGAEGGPPRARLHRFARHWSARDGTLVFTGDVGHGRHLQEVFDFIHRLAAQAHRLGGRIVWTLGNHDLYVDREGGQGGEDSLGYRLWPTIREAALHPERHPGLSVQAAYFEYGKLFVHGGVLPNIVELAMRERGARDARDRRVLRERRASPDARRTRADQRARSAPRDLPYRDEPHAGTAHARRDRVRAGRRVHAGSSRGGPLPLPRRSAAAGRRPHREPQGRDPLLPWFVARRDYIAIDVGRQHGTGNGGLLLTDFGWVAVTPGGPARFVEVSPLFVELARKAASEPWHEEQGEAH